MSIDLNAVGTAIASIVVGGGALASGGYAWWLRQQKAKALNRADVAEADAARKVADAEGAVYVLLEKRLHTLEQEMASVRAELQAERTHSHRLERQCNRMEIHIMRLEHLMKQAGIEPPKFEPDAGAAT